VSDTDSFIDEVTEEVQRDKLYRVMRKYGWIAILAVIVLVGGAAWNEWTKARKTADAQALGDAILTAIESDGPVEARIAALSDLQPDTDAAAIVALITSAQMAEGDARADAIAKLKAIGARSDLPTRYTHLAQLKAVMLDRDSAPADKMDALSALTQAGAPYRVLAREQMAVAQIEMGDTQGAIETLQSLMQDAEASQGLQQRASQLIVALGGDPVAQ